MNTAEARLARRGGEFLVNSVSGGGQQDPQIVALPDGGFFLLWQRGGNVVARRFGAASQPLGPEFQVNQTAPGTPQRSRVAAGSDGSVLVVWCAFMPPDQTGIVGRRYDSTGAAEGPQFTILDRGSYGGGAVATIGAHDFVVAWTDDVALRARATTVGPTGTGGIFQVAQDGTQYDLAIGPYAAGAFHVVWYGEPLATMQGRSFSGERPTGDVFPISRVTSSTHQGPAICAHDAGDFVVAWVTTEDPGGNGTTSPVRYRIYDAASSPVTLPLAVTPEEINQDLGTPVQIYPAVACGPGSEFTVVWLDVTVYPEVSIRGRGFSDNTSTLDFRIGLVGESGGISVARLKDGDEVVTWNECTTSNECDVLAQRFTSASVSESAGDCNADGKVTISELVTIVNIILAGDSPAITRRCLMADTDLDYKVEIYELLSAVNESLREAQ
ncbi:MAG: hypothetical protein ABI629_17270 [bacterium]